MSFSLCVAFFCLSNAWTIGDAPRRVAGSHPGVVFITASNQQKVAEGCGALIAPRVVLTAAHCVSGYDEWKVLAPHTRDGPAQAVAKTAKIHPHYKQDPFTNDLAVLILEDDIDLGGELPTLYGSSLLPLGTKLFVVGHAHNRERFEAKAFKAATELVAFPGNINVYGGNPTVVEKGDSGGPVFVQGKERVIVAVVKGGVSFSRSNLPTDCYVPITAKNKAWILQQTPKNDK